MVEDYPFVPAVDIDGKAILLLYFWNLRGWSGDIDPVEVESISPSCVGYLVDCM